MFPLLYGLSDKRPVLVGSSARKSMSISLEFRGIPFSHRMADQGPFQIVQIQISGPNQIGESGRMMDSPGISSDGSPKRISMPRCRAKTQLGLNMFTGSGVFGFLNNQDLIPVHFTGGSQCGRQ
jgi:hypothetical protein